MTLTVSPTGPVLTFVRTLSATVPVRTYGSMRSIRCALIRLYLARAGVVSDYVDVDRETSDLPIQAMPGPSVYVDGEWLHAPGLHQLEEALVRHGLIREAGET